MTWEWPTQSRKTLSQCWLGESSKKTRSSRKSTQAWKISRSWLLKWSRRDSRSRSTRSLFTRITKSFHSKFSKSFGKCVKREHNALYQQNRKLRNSIVMSWTESAKKRSASRWNTRNFKIRKKLNPKPNNNNSNEINYHLIKFRFNKSLIFDYFHVYIFTLLEWALKFMDLIYFWEFVHLKRTSL